MECSTCKQTSAKLNCAKCLRDGLRAYNIKMKQIQLDRSKQVERANVILGGGHARAQQLIAEKHARKTNLERLERESAALREEIKNDTERVFNLRHDVQYHRATLQSAMQSLKVNIARESSKHRARLEEIRTEHGRVYEQTVVSKKVLVAELVSLFQLKKVEVVELTPKPPRGGSDDGSGDSNRRRMRPEYWICGLRMPNGRHDFTKLPRDEYNAGIGHVLHMTNQVAQYLGIKMPFQMLNQGSKSCVMVNRQVPKLSPAKRKPTSSRKYPLYLQSVTNDNRIPAFVIGLAMLNYNIAYLCDTQGVHIPVEKAQNTLANLSALCAAPGLGGSSHNTTFTPQPTQTFDLDLRHLATLISSRLPPALISLMNTPNGRNVQDLLLIPINRMLYRGHDEPDADGDDTRESNGASIEESSDWVDVPQPSLEEDEDDERSEGSSTTLSSSTALASIRSYSLWGGK